MPDNLAAGNFRIVSLNGGFAGAINDPNRAWQCIRLNLPQADTTWEVVEDNGYRLRVGGYAFTGLVEPNYAEPGVPEPVLDSWKVIAARLAHLDEQWVATYRVAQDAYTIGRGQSPNVWTVQDPVAPENPNPVIKLRSIIPQPESEPPTFAASQLFRFQVPPPDPAP